jgi:hypothetical protein
MVATFGGSGSGHVNPLHLLKASSPMEIMLLGSVTEVREVLDVAL